jgi:hypothetical protein
MFAASACNSAVYKRQQQKCVNVCMLQLNDGKRTLVLQCIHTIACDSLSLGTLAWPVDTTE